jgi:hypothetical protein
LVGWLVFHVVLIRKDRNRRKKRLKRFKISKWYNIDQHKYRIATQMITRNSSPTTFTTHTGQGATVGYGVSVQPQPGMGQGLVARQIFLKNDIVTQYEGELITRNEADTPGFNATHVYSFGKLCIDGFKDREIAKGYGGGSFANHDSVNPNVRYVHDELGNVFLVATTTIAIGDFIMADYGSSYIKAKGLFIPV